MGWGSALRRRLARDEVSKKSACDDARLRSLSHFN
jgi:hypothetical protein